MKWIQATHETPKDKQEVLVTKKDDFFIASYLAQEKVFHCKNGTKFGIAEDVKWAELERPTKNTW